MSVLSVGVRVKDFFFDRADVLARMDKKKARALSRAGAFIRRTAKGLIRPVGKKGKASKPGSPPKSRTGLLRDFIFFAYDASSSSVVVGPAKLGGRAGVDVPNVLEFGGTVQWKGRRLLYQPRPYMNPALKRNIKKIPAEFAGQLKDS